jgi:hypothetical protein
VSDTVKIAGKEFKPVVNSTMRHDIWVQGQIERAGLGNLSVLEHETPEDFARRVFRMACMNADVFLLLGGLIMPVDENPVKWTVDMAKQTAEFLGNVIDDRDKAIVQAQIHSALTSFFITGLLSLTTSQRSSQKTGDKPSTGTGGA